VVLERKISVSFEVERGIVLARSRYIWAISEVLETNQDKRKPWSARSAGTKVQLHSPLLSFSAFLEISPLHGCSARTMASVAQHAENEYVTHALRTPYSVPQPDTA
jgi:hypothetical protein